MNARLVEQARVVPAIEPQNVSGTAVNGTWVSLKNFRRCMIVLHQGAWAGGTPAVTLQQAKDSSGTGAKALAMDTYWQGTVSSDVPTVNTVVSNTFNLPNQANTVTEIEVNAQDLDNNNGFQFIQVQVASPGSNADFLAADYILYEAAHAIRPDYGLSALT